ncbi:DUF2079 domain-containing protein [Actinomyces massiliensis]|uniref:DUF2079 domain-containing protein n=1 Tax=Actinomyces massiliensis TaxID=461393 RepID=UPI00037DD379
MMIAPRSPESLNSPESLRHLRPLGRADGAAVLDRLPAALAVLVGAWVLIAYSVGQWRSMTVPSWDLAIFAELAKAYAHGQAPIVPIKGDNYNLLGDHFHPILVLLGPIWRLFPTPLALLVVQDLLLAVSAWPLTRLATRLTSRSVGTALGLFYVLSWGFQGAAQAQFHEIAFAVPMLAWASVAFVERRWKTCALWLVPLVLVKEDMGLTLIMAGGAIALRGWQKARAGEPDDAGSGPAKRRSGRFIWAWDELPTAVRLGARLALFGLLAFILTVFIIVPLLSPTGSWQYGLGGNAGDGMTAAHTGGTLLDRLFSPEVKIATLFMLVCTAGGIGLASPWMALMLPTLGWRFLADKEAYWEWKLWHYNAALIPIALGALLDVIARLRARRARRAATGTAQSAQATEPTHEGAHLPPDPDDAPAAPAEAAEAASPAAPAQSPALLDAGSPDAGSPAEPAAEPAVEAPAGWLAAPVWARRMVAVGVVVPLITCALTASDLPLWAMTEKNYGAPSSRNPAARQVLDAIPEGASVETDLTLLAYLVPKATVSWVGTSGSSGQAKDYVVVDSRSTAWGGRPPKDAAQWATQTRRVAYELVLDVDGFQVAKRID